MVQYGGFSNPSDMDKIIPTLKPTILKMRPEDIIANKQKILECVIDKSDPTSDLFEKHIFPIVKHIYPHLYMDSQFQYYIHELYFGNSRFKVLELFESASFLFIRAHHELCKFRTAEAKEIILFGPLTFPLFYLLTHIEPDLNLDIYRDLIQTEMEGEFMFQYLQKNMEYFKDCLYDNDPNTLEFQIYSGMILIESTKEDDFECKRILAVLYDKAGRSDLFGFMTNLEATYKKTDFYNLSTAFNQVHSLLDNNYPSLEDLDDDDL